MKKANLIFLIVLFVSLFGAKVVSAYEGSFSIGGSGVSCKAMSVWYESRYRVIGRCEGLVYPYATQYEYYTIWAHDVARKSYVRVDDIDRGYFEGDVNGAFDKLLITAEQDSGPRKPSEKVVASGSVEKFSFDKSQVVLNEVETTKETSNNSALSGTKTMTVQQNKANATNTASSATSNLGSVIGRIITSLIVIVLVLVAIVVAGSLIFRSRGSVSG